MEDFGDMMTETKITVGNGMCGAIIGKRGQRIREIRYKLIVKSCVTMVFILDTAKPYTNADDTVSHTMHI